MSLDHITMKYFGTYYVLKAELEGEGFLYRCPVIVKSDGRSEETGMRFDIGKQVFIDFPETSLSKVSIEDKEKARLEMSKVYSTLFREGYVRFKQIDIL
jgi:hypothetical protein